MFWLAVFILSIALDALDGWLARKLGSSSSVGSFIDILADRLTEYPAWILLSYGNPSLRVIMLIIIARNLMVDMVKLEAVRRGIIMEAGVPKMSGFGEFVVNHPACKTAHNIFKLAAIVLSLAGAFYIWRPLQLAALAALLLHAVFCAVRGPGSILELRSIWRAARHDRTNEIVLRYAFQCGIGVLTLGVVLGSYLVW